MVDTPKILPCFFGLGVLCPFRRSEKSGMMDRCFRCHHYLEFLRAMEEAEIEFWDEVEERRRARARKKVACMPSGLRSVQ